MPGVGALADITAFAIALPIPGSDAPIAVETEVVTSVAEIGAGPGGTGTIGGAVAGADLGNATVTSILVLSHRRHVTLRMKMFMSRADFHND